MAGGVSKLGRFVKERRTAEGLTRVALLARGDVRHGLLQGPEQGTARYVTAEQVVALARALGVPVAEVWELIPPSQRGCRYMDVHAWNSSGEEEGQGG